MKYSLLGLIVLGLVFTPAPKAGDGGIALAHSYYDGVTSLI